MKNTVSMMVGSQVYDLAPEEVEEFSKDAAGQARKAFNYRFEGRDYAIPEDEAEEFARDTGGRAEPLRRLSFEDGSSRSFTTAELRDFYEKEYRSGDRYRADREASMRAAREKADAAGTQTFSTALDALSGAAYSAMKFAAPLVRSAVTAPMRLAAAGVDSGAAIDPLGVTGVTPPEGATGAGIRKQAEAIDAAVTPSPETEEDVGPAARAAGKVAQTAGGILSFATALRALGPAAGNALMSAEAGNDTYLSIYDNAVAKGADPETAARYAAAGGAAATLGTAAIGASPLARMLKLPQPVMDMAGNPSGYRDLVRSAMVGSLIRHAERTGLSSLEMGGYTFAESYLAHLARLGSLGGDVTSAKANIDALYAATEEGATTAGIAIALGAGGLAGFRKNVRAAVEAEAARAAATPEGRMQWARAFPEGTQAVMAKRYGKADVSRAEIERAGYPAMSQEARNAIGDALLSDAARAYEAQPRPGRIAPVPPAPKPAEPPPKPAEPPPGKPAPQGDEAPILSGDEVRKTMPGYDPKNWRTHVDKSGYVAPRMEERFQELLSTRKGKGNGEVVFLAGGNGSGKSTVANAEGADADFIIDSTLGNLEVAKKQIEAVLSNGQKPAIDFVYRTPEQALKGVVERVENGGHAVSPLSFADSHTKGIKNLRLLADEYGDKIAIRIFDNSVEGMPRLTLEQLEAKGIPDHAELRAKANEVLGQYGGLARQVGARSVDGSGAEVEGAQGEEAGASKPRLVNKGKGKVPAKPPARKPKPAKADPKKAAKIVGEFVSKDPARKTLAHVYHDHEGGVAVASDGRVLIATKHGYDPGAKDNPDAPYPNWRQIVPDYGGKTYRVIITEEYVASTGKWKRKAVDLPVHTVETDPAAVSAACRKAASLAKAAGHKGIVNAVITLPDGKRIIMDPAYLRKVADAMNANGITEIKAVNPDSPILAKNADTTVVAMPLRGDREFAAGRAGGNALVVDALTGRILSAPARSDGKFPLTREYAQTFRKKIEEGKKEVVEFVRSTSLYQAIVAAWERGETDARAVYDGAGGDGAFDKLSPERKTEFEGWLSKKGQGGDALAEQIAVSLAERSPASPNFSWHKKDPLELAKIERRIAAEDEIDALMAGAEPPPAPKPKGKGKVPKSVQAAKALGSPDAASPLRPAPKGAGPVQGELDGLGGSAARLETSALKGKTDLSDPENVKAFANT